MANILRGSIRVEIPAPRQPTVWPGPNLLTNTLQLGANPFHQAEWPNPVLARAPIHNRGWINDPFITTLQLPNPKPNLLSDWPNPTLRLRTVEHLTWVNESTALDAMVVTMPFFVEDLTPSWPRRRQVVPYHYRVKPVPLPSTPVTDPFVPVLFPNPLPKRYPAQPNVIRYLDSVFELDPTTLSHDWTNPVRRVWTPFGMDVQDALNFSLAQANPAPFAMTQWPNPIRGLSSNENLFGYTEYMNRTLGIVLPVPFFFTDFPNPRGPEPLLQKPPDPNATFILAPPLVTFVKIRKTLAELRTKVKSRQRHRTE